jgi:4-amino-4-deoxy-L-arabinose transferase-like glycosyltransferase
MVGLSLLALVVRWPSLWLVPRFTDETLEVLQSLKIVREGLRPLTNYDTYYGALYNYLVAAALAVSGESPLAPRVVVLLAGIATVAATYLLGTEVGRRLRVRRDGGSGSAVGPRLVGLIAAGLLATNGPHVVVNSHIAWSNCLTPLLTTLACWAVLRTPRFLPLAGLLLGLALQTHPLVVALLPGIALAVVLRDWRTLKTPWPWLALVAFLIGYANMLVFNAETGFESLKSAQRMQVEYGSDQQAASGYAPTAGAMLLLLGRIVGGAVDQRASVAAYLADPSVVFVGSLAVVGVAMLAARRELLPLLACASFLLILPAANPKFQTLLTTRYLMPIVPLLFACAAFALLRLAESARAHWPKTGRRPLLAALMVGMLLAALPLASLDRYYARTFERSDTNQRILRLTSQIEAARRDGEIVLVDDSIGAELPDTGVTEVRGLEYLLTVERVPYKLVKPSPGRLQDSLDAQPTALAILNSRDAAAAGGRVKIESLDPRPPSETGRMFDFRLYRLSRDRA